MMTTKKTPSLLAQNLMMLRSQHRLSLRKLAKEIEVSVSHLHKLETVDSSSPSVYLVVRLAAFFGVTVEALLFEDLANPEISELRMMSAYVAREIDRVFTVAEKRPNEADTCADIVCGLTLSKGIIDRRIKELSNGKG